MLFKICKNDVSEEKVVHLYTIELRWGGYVSSFDGELKTEVEWHVDDGEVIIHYLKLNIREVDVYSDVIDLPKGVTNKEISELLECISSFGDKL